MLSNFPFHLGMNCRELFVERQVKGNSEGSSKIIQKEIKGAEAQKRLNTEEVMEVKTAKQKLKSSANGQPT